MKQSVFHLLDKKAKLPILVVCTVAYMAFHLYTLPFSPLPWFDEVFFANASINFRDSGIPQVTILDKYISGPLYMYGPVYFFIQAKVLSVAPVVPEVFRLLNFLSGLGIIFFLVILFRNTNTGKQTFTIIFFLLLALDPIFNQNLHSGRMDLLGSFFIVLSLFFLKKDERSSNKYYAAAVSGLLVSLAFLTTPRALFLGVIPAYVLVSKWPGEIQKFLVYRVFTFAVFFLVPVSLYVFWTVGGLNHYISAFQKAEGHFGGSLFRQSYENPAIAIFLLLVVSNHRKVLGQSFLMAMVLGFISFSLFVKEVGPYSAMIMPFVYFVIVSLASQQRYRKIAIGLVGILFLLNLSIYMLKNVVVITGKEERQMDARHEKLLKQIPAGSKILADFRFFYWALDNHHNFQCHDIYKGSWDEYVKFTIDEFGAGYVIGRSHDKFSSDSTFQSQYVKIGEVETNRKKHLMNYIDRYFVINSNFDFILYKRKELINF